MRKIRTVLVAVICCLLCSSACPAGPEDVPSLKKADDYVANIPIRVVKEFSLPRGYHEGLYYDGKYLWVCNGKGGNIWLVHPDTGEVADVIKPVGTFTEAITTAGDGTFWMTDWDTKKLYRVEVAGSGMTVKYDISLEPAHPAGAVWTGDKLYVITWTRGMGTQYHLMQLDKEERMSRKTRIKRIHEPAQMAWDGKYLWITSWYSHRVYKVDVDTFRVLGSFKSPARDTTGIAWDGRYFWVTGSHTGLYQVEVLREK